MQHNLDVDASKRQVETISKSIIEKSAHKTKILLTEEISTMTVEQTAEGAYHQAKKEQSRTSTTAPATPRDIEPIQYDDNIILQACPSANAIFCDSVSALAEILSFEGDDAREEIPTTFVNDQTTQWSPTYPRYSNSSTISKSCLTPRDGEQCQRRGRFLVWPASLQAPSFTVTQEASD